LHVDSTTASLMSGTVTRQRASDDAACVERLTCSSTSSDAP
jgi:hypothetical protein